MILPQQGVGLDDLWTSLLALLLHDFMILCTTTMNLEAALRNGVIHYSKGSVLSCGQSEFLSLVFSS